MYTRQLFVIPVTESYLTCFNLILLFGGAVFSGGIFSVLLEGDSKLSPVSTLANSNWYHHLIRVHTLQNTGPRLQSN